jgi:hypothetical protein
MLEEGTFSDKAASDAQQRLCHTWRRSLWAGLGMQELLIILVIVLLFLGEKAAGDRQWHGQGGP